MTPRAAGIWVCLATALWWAVLLTDSGAFFRWDEWSILRSLAYSDSVLAWAAQTHLGHVNLLPKLFFWLEIRALSDVYPGYVYVNVLVHTANVTLLFALLCRAGFGAAPAAVASLFYGLLFPHAVNLAWGMQVMLLQMVFVLLLSLWFACRYAEDGGWQALLASVLCSFLSALCFGIGLVTGPLNALFYLALQRDLEARRFASFALAHAGASVLAAVTVLAIAASADQTTNHPGAVLATLDIAAIRATLSSPQFAGFMLRGVVALPVQFLTLGHLPDRAIVWIGLGVWGLLGAAVVRSSRGARCAARSLGLLLAANALMMILPGLSRSHSHPAFTGRYQAFALLPTAFALAAVLRAALPASPPRRAVVGLALAFLLFEAANAARTRSWIDAYGAYTRPMHARYLTFKERHAAMPPAHGDLRGERLFLPALNPELTRAELHRIIDRLF